MANLETKNLLVAVKAFARANALPLDKDEVWESLSEAQAYAASPTAYAGQTIKVLMNGKYQPFILQPSATGGTGLQLEETGGSGGGSSVAYVQIVDTLPEIGQIQGVIYIQNSDNKGYIWTGEEYKAIFSDVSMEVSQLKADLETKASLSGATFTGEVILHADPTQDMGAATKHYVDNLISNLVSAAPGVVDSANPLPSSYQAGQTWRVAEAGVYAGQDCEVGDLIICTLDSSGEFKDSDFIVVQSNIDGAVTGPEEAIDATLVIFDGITGKKLGGSNVTIASVEEAIAMKHEHSNLEILESFTKTQEQIEKAIDKKYQKVAYEVVGKPAKSIVDYREKEIRLLCAADTEWTFQNSGANANKNYYYFGLKAYAPDDAVSFKEDSKEHIEDDTMFYFEDNDFAGIDEFGRKYSIIWLPAAAYDSVGDVWNYYGSKSSKDKYVGWYYTVEWYNAEGVVISSDTIRINLTNEDCHRVVEPFYIGQVKKDISASIAQQMEEAILETKGYVEDRLGIPVGTSVKQYVDNAIGSGGTDASEAIAEAKLEAIAESKKYTDEALLIYEF